MPVKQNPILINYQMDAYINIFGPPLFLPFISKKESYFHSENDYLLHLFIG